MALMLLMQTAHSAKRSSADRLDFASKPRRRRSAERTNGSRSRSPSASWDSAEPTNGLSDFASKHYAYQIIGENENSLLRKLLQLGKGQKTIFLELRKRAAAMRAGFTEGPEVARRNRKHGPDCPDRIVVVTMRRCYEQVLEELEVVMTLHRSRVVIALFDRNDVEGGSSKDNHTKKNKSQYLMPPTEKPGSEGSSKSDRSKSRSPAPMSEAEVCQPAPTDECVSLDAVVKHLIALGFHELEGDVLDPELNFQYPLYQPIQDELQWCAKICRREPMHFKNNRSFAYIDPETNEHTQVFSYNPSLKQAAKWCLSYATTEKFDDDTTGTRHKPAGQYDNKDVLNYSLTEL